MAEESTPKDKLLASLLQPKAAPKPSATLIQVLGEENDNLKAESPKEAEIKSSAPAQPAQDEGPTLFEAMMAAQKAAKQEKEKEETVAVQKDAKKTFGSGFKKGFLNSGSKSSTKPSSTSKAPTTTTTSTSKTTSAPADIPTIKKSPSSIGAATDKKSNLVIDEVQDALKNDENPLLGQLKQGEWVTPDLLSKFQGNPILAKGLSDPRCMQILQRLQQNPKEVMEQYRNEPFVDQFIREFGKVMSEHFESMAASGNSGNTGSTGSTGSSGKSNSNPSNNNSSSSSNSGQNSSKISEIGPLHAEAMKRQKEIPSKPATNEDEEQKKVQQILSNDEIRTLLMDPSFQRVLQECNDPKKLQMHMNNPDTARKIKLLMDSGLVQMQR